ncbi:MAG: T9SS type A sorting domain-containing protein [Cyclobacteriaceae bacterium]|nr:T9SS type A sorting domain-containing protein [Cyclobacteriaceae bacterium]
MKKTIYIVALLLVPLVIYAATRTVTGSGNWSNTGIWQGGTLPISTDDVSMNNSTSATILNGESFTVNNLTAGNSAVLTIDAGGSLTINGNLTTNNNTVINVDGDLTINGNVTINNNLVLNVTGTLTIIGSVSVLNGAGLTVTSTGAVSIGGAFTGGNNTDIAVDGAVSVGGDFTVGNGSTATGTGSISVTGTCADGGGTVCSSAVLPVKLLYFKAKIETASIYLSWATYEEENFDYFSLEKSVDGIRWNSIGEIKGMGWSYDINNYDYTDTNPINGVNYYRLKAIDLDGTCEYHPAISANFRGNAMAFDIYPNPSNGSKIDIQLNFKPTEDIELTIFNLQGSAVYRNTISDYMVTISEPGLLRSGIYHVQLKSESGLMLNQKLMIK